MKENWICIEVNEAAVTTLLLLRYVPSGPLCWLTLINDSDADLFISYSVKTMLIQHPGFYLLRIITVRQVIWFTPCELRNWKGKFHLLNDFVLFFSVWNSRDTSWRKKRIMIGDLKSIFCLHFVTRGKIFFLLRINIFCGGSFNRKR